jgi:glycosidase
MRFPLTVFFLGVMMASAASQSASPKMSLDGEWLFKADSLKAGVDAQWYLDSLDRSSWEVVSTPAFWESYPGLAKYDGWGWYAKTFVPPRVSVPQSVYFAGVDDDATVWINGKEVGSHTGYSDPFTVDVTPALREGRNTIVVLVRDNAGGGGIYRPVTLIATSALEELLRGPFFGTPALKSADWVRDAVIYCADVRVFSPEGTFAALERRVGELKNLGATVLWLMPIHPVGFEKRKGTYGSPYSVQDYYGVNRDFGTLADFKRLLATVHRNGMKLIIDLVANHAAWDSKLVKEHPDWFTRDASGNIVSPNPDWTDVADLDYTKPGLREYMTTMMVWWVRDIGIDGFRCDVAEMVPTDFWQEARSRLNRIKPVMMLAEGSLPEHHVRAFDISYSWNIYDALPPLLQCKRPVTLLDQIFRTEYLQFPTGSLRMRFTTNHDKNFYDAPAVERYGLDGLKLATVLMSTIPGIPLIYNGEEIPNDRRINHHERTPIEWRQPYLLAPLLTQLSTLRKNHPALRRGQMIRIQSSAPDTVYAFLRVAGSDRVLIVLNFSPENTIASLSVPVGNILPGQRKFVLENELLGGTRTLTSDQFKDLSLELPGRGYAVYSVR